MSPLRPGTHFRQESSAKSHPSAMPSAGYLIYADDSPSAEYISPPTLSLVPVASCVLPSAPLSVTSEFGILQGPIRDSISLLLQLRKTISACQKAYSVA